jgi:uncharacterized protein YdbL (DUF1318 family)
LSFRARQFRYSFVACALASTSSGCGKFQQARECGTFVKTVNGWLGSSAPADAGVSNDPQQIAVEARRTADQYADLSRTLAGLKIQAEELAPRVKRYEAIADDAARTLREVADALDRGDLEQARKKRVDFDTVARLEGPLVKEINGICR